MDASPHSASSNVTVEYTDPSDLFTSIQPFVSEILPLRNLHWKSPTRPLRSIDSLQVDFIPAQNAAEGQKRLSDGPGSAISRRRHQIPGLRQTPYLKIYLLRCDDNDTYKSTSRKVVREWIKNHASPPQSSSTGNQDNHDAFEYLVIHVLPATATGADPAEKAAPKWPGQRSTSVLEKLKADFNGSSKNAVDRVVQLRLPKSEGPQKSPELSASLEDLVTKLKSGILTSFDLRVSQYEEDIREKDSQRSLPGWNFCTFFILKEGLARGFEHVGLYEDALVGYDELSVGLDAVLRDQLGGVGDQHGGTFLNHTEDIKSKAEKALSEAKEANKGEEASDSSSDDEEDSEGDEEVGVSSSIFPSPISLDLEFFPLEPYKKPYRDMILANNISIFDFRTYIFSRQMVLLLKAAGAPYLREKGSEGQIATTHARRSEDLVLLSEVCERASEFISIGSRTLRHDLEDGMKQLEKSYDASVVSEIINNMVHSWTYGAVSQVLIQTTTNSLDLPKSSILNNRDLVDPSALASFIADTRPGIPKRSSSLSFVPEVNGRPVSEEIMSPDLHNGVQGRDPFATLKRDSTETQKTGTAELSSIRGDLFLFARRTLEKLGRRRGWLESWRNLSLLYDENGHSSGDLEDVPLDRDNEAPGKSSESKEATPLHEGMDIPILLQAGKCRKQFDALYERLSDQIFRHYVAANRTRSAQMVMSDIAVLKYRAGHYSFAASYFHQLIPFYASTQWDVLEGATLEVYGRCLKELGRTDDYVRVMLRLLGQYARGARAGYIIKPQKSKRLSSAAPSSFSATTKFVISKFVDDLFQSSRSLSKELSAPLNDFFGSIYVNPSIRHYKDKDGFQLQLSLRYLLGHEIKIDDARIRLVSVSDSNNEIWLENSQSIVVRSSVTTVSLGSFVSVNGKYTLDRIELRTGNIVFVQSNAAQSSLPPGFRETIADESSDEDERPIIICYPRVDGLSAKVLPSLHIDLGELRTIEFELKSGSNDVRNGTLRVRPATAGLRLRISDMEVVDGFIKLRETTDSGSIEFEDFKPGSSARFSVPFSTEGLQTTLAARLEVSYETPDGNFSYSSTATIDSSLPLSVNVQDMFKEDALFSRFTVSPATITPVRLLNCRVPGSPALDVESSMKQDEILDVFPRQPASLLCKIIQRNSERHKPDGAKYSLALTIEFTCLDEEGLFAVERQFTKDIGSSAFSGLENLLVPHLLEAFRNQWKGSDLEIIGLIREVEVFSYERVQWETMTASLDAQLQKDVTAWLVDWHKKHQILPLSDSKASAPNRQIVIPVDVPDVQVVHTADLTLPNMAGDSVHPIHATVGEMIPAQLNLRHTRRWCPASNREPSSDLEFSYEILTNPEMWLIGGRRRGNYTAKEGETRSFTVMLLPQRSGHLLLPGLEVKTFVLQPAEPRDAFAPSQRKQIHCEVDYRSHAESVLVVPDLRKTTIGLDASGSAGGGSWLVDSERRVGFASS